MPGFVERSQAIASLPSLALLTLAALTPDSFEVSYHEIEDIRTAGEPPACDLAAIASYSAQIKDAYLLADRYRALGVRTVLGGLHVTALPGRGARSMPTRSSSARASSAGPTSSPTSRRGRLERVYGPRGREFDLADAPMPRFDLLDVERYNRITVQTQRGCPWRCEFCAASIKLTDRYKVKPVDKVLAEIHEIKRLWPAPFIEFADDNSFVDRRHSKELLRALVGERIRWFTETDVAIADDPELLDLMHAAGCAEVLIGLESPTASGVDGVETRRNWKRSRFDDYAAAIERIQAHGIAVNGCFVLGLDGDGPEVFDAGRGLRPPERPVRRPDHRHDALSRHSAVRPSARRGPPPRADGLGALHAVRRQLPAPPHDARAPPGRGARARPTGVHGGGASRPAAAVP